MTTRLQVGDAAPEFTLTDDAGRQVSLADFRGQRVIVYFYPAALTPGCTTQACDFSDSLAALTAYGAYGEKKLYGKTVVGVIRSTFVVDADGTVADARYNVKATGHVAKLRHDLGL